MKQLPRLHPLSPKQPDGTDSVVLAVYAPFGTDAILSRYPDSQVGIPIQRQVLVKALQRVAREGVHVSALIDLHDDDSYLVEIPALQPKAMRITSVWKQDMTSPRALAGFLRRTHAVNPCAAIALALEGHGAGYIPEIDAASLTPEKTTSNGDYEWTFANDEVRLNPAPGSPALPVFSSVLPVFSSVLPAVDLPLSTSGLASALRLSQRQGVPKPAVIHFNNCFNMSVEHLHTVAPHADYATGYGNYNFFTSGTAYPLVFRRLRQAGIATREALAQWFADENGLMLRAKGNHPTIGGVVRLARLREIAQCIDALAGALLTALRPRQPGQPSGRAGQGAGRGHASAEVRHRAGVRAGDPGPGERHRQLCRRVVEARFRHGAGARCGHRAAQCAQRRQTLRRCRRTVDRHDHAPTTSATPTSR